MCVFLAICHDLVCYKMLFLNGKEVDNDDGKEVDNDDDSGFVVDCFYLA